MKRSATVHNQRGFTLLEVIIAVMVLTVGLVSTAAMQTRAVDESNEAYRQSERVMNSEYWMEDLINRPVVADREIEPDEIFSDNCTGDRECADGSWFDSSSVGVAASSSSSYRVVPGNPMPFLMTIEVRTEPSYGHGGSDDRDAWLDKKAVTFSYIRSSRYN